MLGRKESLPGFLSLVIAIFFASLASSSPAKVEEPSTGTIYQQRLDVEVVSIDVVVTDKKGRVVKGLALDDFELRIDGRLVPIANFRFIDGYEGAALPRPRSLPSSVEGSSPSAAQPPHLIVYVDSFYLTPQSRKRVVRDLPDFLEQHVAAGGQVMLVHRASTTKVLTPLTTDLDELSAALESVETMPALGMKQKLLQRTVMSNIQSIYEICEDNPWQNPCTDCMEIMLEMARSHSLALSHERRAAMAAFGSVVSALGVLEGKKVLLHVSDGIQQQAGVDIFHYLFDRLCPTQRTQNQQYFLRLDLHDLNDLIAQANASRVTLYALEAAGLRGFSSASAEHGDSFFVPSAVNDQIRVANLQGSLFFISNETGGKAILNANQFAPDLDKLADEFRTYYSLGFQPEHTGEGKAHRVGVKVGKRGYRVRFRRSFLHKKLEQQLADKVFGAIMFGVTRNPLGAEVWQGQQSPGPGPEGSRSVTIEVAVPVEKLTLMPRDGARSGQLTVIVAAPDEKGKKRVIRKKELMINVPLQNSEGDEEAYRFGVNLELALGRHELGVGIWDEVAAVGSFLSLQIEVRAETGDDAEPSAWNEDPMGLELGE